MLHGIHSRRLSNSFKFSTLLSVLGWLLLGFAAPLWAQVTATPPAWNFSAWVPVGVATGSMQTLTFSIPSGTTVGGISALTLGAPNLDYTVVTGGTTCALGLTATTTICTVQVQFLPTVPGTRLGAVVFTDSSTPPNVLITVPLSGTGTGPMVAFGPGTITTVAGNGTGGYYNDGGLATLAELDGPHGVAVDGARNFYIADTTNNRIRKVTPGGIITTYAGTGAAGSSGDGGLATSAELNSPYGVALDGAGNLYIADTTNNRIRMVTPGGIITRYAGTGAAGSGGDNGPATSAELNSPYGVAVDGAGNLYIADTTNNRIRMVTLSSGIITTVAGNGSGGFSGDGNPATSAQLYNPFGVAVDGSGNLYIADFDNSRIREVTGGIINTVAGNGAKGFGGDGNPATSAELFYPTGVAVDGVGNLYIADTDNDRIRMVAAGIITTVAGNGTQGGSGDGGPATSAELYSPAGVAVDGSGNLYIADEGNNRIREDDVSDVPPPVLSFASTDLGVASAAQDVAVLNLGNTLLTISQISVAANFNLSGSDTTCSSSSQKLQPAFSCVLGIEFSPTVGDSIIGSVILTDNALNAGTATQSIVLQGTGIPPAATTTTLAAAPAPVALGGTTTLTASVSSATPGTITGTVTFSIGSTTLGTAPVSGGEAMLNVVVSAANGFSAGSNTITAAYGGETTSYAASTGSTSLTVSGVAAATTTALAISSNPAALNGSISLVASISSGTAGTITGPVTFSIGSTILGTAPVIGTQATANVVVSTANGFIGGANTLTATYGGNATYATSTGSAPLTVTGVANPTTTALAASPSTAMLGGTTTLTATVSSSPAGTLTGSVTFMMGGTTLGTTALVNGAATLSDAAVTTAYGFWIGTDPVTAIYSGNANYAGSTGSTPLLVSSPPQTTTALTAAPASLTLGGSTELVAVVSTTNNGAGTISNGTVTFTVGTTTLGTGSVNSGFAKLVVTANATNGFSVGTDTVTANYGGYGVTYAPSSGTSPVTVLAPTSTTLTAAPAWVTLAGTTELVASVTSTTAGAIAGTVTFTIGNTTLGTAPVSGGLATLPSVAVSATNGFSTGTNTITATYGGNAVYGTSTVNTTMTVTGSAVTATVLTATPAWVTLAGTTSLTASVTSTTPGTVAGNVTFSLGGISLGTAAVGGGGLATLSNVAVNAANGFLAGPNTITAIYDGSANYASSSTSTTVTVTGSALTTTTLTAAPTTAAPGGTTALTAAVVSSIPGTITGTVTFSIGGTNLGTATIASGLATLSSVIVNGANGFTNGSNTITATYGGNTNYAASTGSAYLTVVGPSITTTTLTAAPPSATLGGATTFVASVTSTAGVVPGTVTFTAGPTTLGTATISGGFATLNVTVNAANGFTAGTDTVTATYAGSSNYAASNGSTTLAVLAVTTTTLTAVPASATLGGSTELVASVSSTTGGTIAGTVTFSMGATVLGTATVSGGLATLSKAVVTAANGFSAGTDTITATFGGSTTFATSTGTSTISVSDPVPTTTTVVASPNLVALGGTTALTASVSSTTAGTITGTVTFSIGTTTLGTAAVSSGLATLNNAAVSPASGFIAGSNTITATFGGGGIFAASIGSTTLTVPGPAATTTTVTASPTSATLGGTIGLTASVSSTIPGTITGTVTFAMGSTTLGTATVSGGMATLSNVIASAANGFSVGSNSITATYAGNATDGASTGSTTLTLTAMPTYTMSAAASSTLTAGSSANVILNLSSTNYAGTVSFSATSSFPSLVGASAPSVTLTSNGSGTSTLTISATTSAAKHEPAGWKSGGALMVCAVLLGAPLGLRRKRAIAVLLTALTISLAGLLMACGGGSSSSTAKAAAQTFTVTVSATGTGTVANPAPVTITVTVP
jgi:hypothetical protein